MNTHTNTKMYCLVFISFLFFCIYAQFILYLFVVKFIFCVLVFLVFLCWPVWDAFMVKVQPGPSIQGRLFLSCYDIDVLTASGMESLISLGAHSYFCAQAVRAKELASVAIELTPGAAAFLPAGTVPIATSVRVSNHHDLEK